MKTKHTMISLRYDLFQDSAFCQFVLETPRCRLQKSKTLVNFIQPKIYYKDVDHVLSP